jgi:hypothetical protein
MISATASTAAGPSIMRAPADSKKRLTLELGGHGRRALSERQGWNWRAALRGAGSDGR